MLHHFTIQFFDKANSDPLPIALSRPVTNPS
jgi:hypothetical protein